MGRGRSGPRRRRLRAWGVRCCKGASDRRAGVVLQCRRCRSAGGGRGEGSAGGACSAEGGSCATITRGGNAAGGAGVPWGLEATADDAGAGGVDAEGGAQAHADTGGGGGGGNIVIGIVEMEVVVILYIE